MLNVRVFDLVKFHEAKGSTVHSLMRWGKALKQASQIGAAWRQAALNYKRQHARHASCRLRKDVIGYHYVTSQTEIKIQHTIHETRQREGAVLVLRNMY